MASVSNGSPLVLVVFIAAAAITVGSAYYSWRYLPKKMTEAYRKSLYTIAAAVETKDSGTLGHAQRVARHALAVARELGVHGPECLRIERAAVLRDIGKVNLPHRLLNKRDPLTPEEWEKLKSHSKMGANMVTEIAFLADTADLIRHHHEHWDGTGYPEALAGEAIPLGARILAVATDYDAAISDRPYHDAQSISEALGEMERDSGTSYDPKVVEAFLRIIERETRQAAA